MDSSPIQPRRLQPRVNHINDADLETARRHWRNMFDNELQEDEGYETEIIDLTDE